jgi:hypothetical protein
MEDLAKEERRQQANLLKKTKLYKEDEEEPSKKEASAEPEKPQEGPKEGSTAEHLRAKLENLRKLFDEDEAQVEHPPGFFSVQNTSNMPHYEYDRGRSSKNEGRSKQPEDP